MSEENINTNEGAMIALKSVHGKYLSAQPDGHAEWNRDHASTWEHFHLEKRQGGKIALKGVHGLYVTAQEDGSLQINRSEAPPGGWEEFTFEERDNNLVCLKSCHGKYLSVQQNGTAQWNRDHAPRGGWEEFQIEFSGSTEKTFNTVEGITMIFRLMLSVDGEVSDEEITKLVELVTPYVEYVDAELESVVANAIEIYNSNTLEENFSTITSFAAIFSERYSHEICVRICKDLATLAWTDGELHENESKYWSHILKAMGVSADEVNAATAVENTNATEDGQSEQSSNEEANVTANKTTLAGCGLSREFGHALDDLPDEKYNDKDITALAKKYNEDVEAALTYAKSAYGWMWSESNEEASAEQQTDKTKYPLFPVNWGVENVIVVPIRHCMIADGVVNQMEKNAMAHFFENFGEIGEMAGLEWDITDDQIMQIHSDGKYGELLVDSAIYLKEHLDDDQLSKLIWYMAEIVCEDDVIQYKEFVTLKFYFDQWYPNALDTYIDKFKAAGMTVITSPDN